MGHYPIKCIHCMRTIKADERCIKVSETDVVGSVADASASERSGGSDFFNLGDSFNSVIEGNSSSFMTIKELRQNGNIESEEFSDVTVSKEYSSVVDSSEKLSQALRLKDLDSNGKKISGTVRTFYCPHCQSRLIGQAGKKPIYLISMLGPSSAGKTVFITMLHLMINGKNYDMPKGYLHFEAVGSTAVEFQEYAENLIRTGKLPGTTTEDRKDPYLMEINYVPDKGTRKSAKSCVLGITDMRGEMLNATRNDDLMRYNLPQFVEADGFIMMVDPEILEGFYKKIPEDKLNRDSNDLSLALTAMRSTINDCITSVIGAIKKPNVIALTKMDLLRKYREMIGIPLTNQVIAPKFERILNTNLYRNYYLPMSSATRQCVEHLSGSFSYYLSTVFERTPFYVSISALGDKVNINGQDVDNSRNLNPIRIEEPIVHLLMDFNFLPPFYRDIFYQFPDECMKTWHEHYAET